MNFTSLLHGRKSMRYSRKSTKEEDEKQVYSIEDQDVENIRIEEKYGLDVVEVYTEDETAKRPGRKQFNKMMNVIYQSKEKWVIVCWKLDRLSRNPVDQGAIQWAVDQKGLVIVTSDRIYAKGAGDQLLMGIEFAMSKKYVDDLSDNVRRGNRSAFERGKWTSNLPVGYKWMNNEVTVDEEKSKLVDRAYELFISGDHSISSLCRFLEAEGFKGPTGGPIYPTVLRKILTNKFYTGIMVSKAYQIELPGNHTPIISSAKFSAADAILSRKRAGKGKRARIHNYPYRGLFKCGECGCGITAEKQKGHVYYRCTKKKGKCSQKYIRKDRLELLFLEIIRKCKMKDSWAELAEMTLREQHDEQMKFRDREKLRLRRQLIDTESKQDALLDALLEKSIDKPTYDRKRGMLETERLESTKAIENLEASSANYLENVLSSLELFKNLSRITKAMSDDVKETILKIVGSNYIIKNNRISNFRLNKLFIAQGELQKRWQEDENPSWCAQLDRYSNLLHELSEGFIWLKQEHGEKMLSIGLISTS